MSIFYVNGAFVPSEQAVIPATDLAVLRGFGAFDYLRTYNGKPFRLEANIARLRRSANIIGLDYSHTDEDIKAIVCQTLEKNRGLAEEFAIRIVLTGGVSVDNITPSDSPGLLVMVTPLKDYPAELYERGVKVITIDIARVFPTAKSINYIPAIVAQRMARAQGGIEALYISKEGNILEATTSNIFAFYGETLITPSENILPGITRQTILEIAREQFTVEEREMSLAEFLQADEIFMTAANKKVMPIRQVDESLIHGGIVGKNTRQMMQLFHAYTQRTTQEA